jgi:hypothetical protein
MRIWIRFTTLKSSENTAFMRVENSEFRNMICRLTSKFQDFQQVFFGEVTNQFISDKDLGSTTGPSEFYSPPPLLHRSRTTINNSFKRPASSDSQGMIGELDKIEMKF